MIAPILLLLLGVQQSALPDTLYAVDLYGLRTTAEADVRNAIGLRAGDALPTSLEPIRGRLLQLPGIEEVDLSTVCCSDNGRTILYVGIRERATPSIAFRQAPTGSARLPDEVMDLGKRFEAALISAVQRGITAEDHSRGYALAEDSALRAVQLEFVRIAAQYFDTVRAVVRSSADAAHRALATQVIAYGGDPQDVARELLHAVDDPDAAVRNNAVRALAVLADGVVGAPDSGIEIPLAPLTDLVNSVSWTDRNKGVMVLIPLTSSRDPAVLAALGAQALESLVEMAGWSNPGHALGPFILVARIAGLEDGEAFQAFQSGEREAVIARARTAVIRSAPPAR